MLMRRARVCVLRAGADRAALLRASRDCDVLVCCARTTAHAYPYSRVVSQRQAMAGRLLNEFSYRRARDGACDRVAARARSPRRAVNLQIVWNSNNVVNCVHCYGSKLYGSKYPGTAV